MIKVNLVPGELLAKARQRQSVVQAVIAGTLAVLLVIFASIWHYGQKFRLSQEFTAKNDHYHKLESVVKQVEDLEAAAKAVRSRLGVIEDLLKGRAFYPIFMSEFARSVPSGVRIISLNTTTQNGAILKLAINGQASANEDVAAWMRTLQGNPHFSAIELGPVTSNGTKLSFSINAGYTNKL